METKEAILATISELSNDNEDKNIESSAQDSEFKADLKVDSKMDSSEKTNIFIDIKEEGQEVRDLGDELNLLLNIKEKTIVLFEGLRSAQKADLEMKLEMVISYLEYQLFVIEERIENLTKEDR